MPDCAAPHGRLAPSAPEWAVALDGVEAFTVAIGFDVDGEPLGAIAAELFLGTP
ncbi:MAG TPA: hypothetical protein VN738_09830 [Acidothermaceae bacterium]|nr:hypothetical protein [Acidothermaceae bacterium]